MKIYVGNLSPRATEEDLAALFARFGEVQDVYLVMDKDTGKARGFGFVFMKDEREALAAIRGLNGTEFQRMSLKVSEPMPKKKKKKKATSQGQPRGYGRLRRGASSGVGRRGFRSGGGRPNRDSRD